jgi:hypothetical protein
MSARKDELEAKLNFAIDAARPALQAAADAAHELKPADPNKAEFERDMEVAMLVNRLALLCGPMLRVLNDVADLLIEHEDDEHDDAPSEQRPN